MIQHKRYRIFLLLFLFFNQIGINQNDSSIEIGFKQENDFEFSLKAYCQTCGHFGNTKIKISKKGKKRIIKIKEAHRPKKIKLRKNKFNKLLDSLIIISQEVELSKFNNFDSLFFSLIPKEQNKDGFPKQLIRVDDGTCYSIVMKTQDEEIKFNSCNPEVEFDMISKYSQEPKKEILSLLGGIIRILNVLRSDLNITI